MENVENKNEITLFTGVKNKIYCSLTGESEEEKKIIYNALESCDVRLNDCVGQEIDIENLYVEEKEGPDKETGELKIKYRTILFDVTGQTYATGSYGVYNSIKKIIQIYGLPETWEKPLRVKVNRKSIDNNKNKLILTLV